MSGAKARLRPVLLLGLATLLSRWLPGWAGQATLYPALGVFPGMALASLIAGRRADAPRWTLGLALSPLASTAAGALLLMVGMTLPASSLLVALAGYAGWAAAEALRPATAAPDGVEPAPDRRWQVGFAVALSAIAATPALLNPFFRVFGDAWIHAGLVWDIVRHGLPPEDPRLAGMRLNYVWFFNLYIAQLVSLGWRDAFVYMAIFNAVNLAVCLSLAYRMGLTLWRDRTAAAGAAALTGFGLNAGAWLLWPLRLGSALLGRTRGWDQVLLQVHDIHFGSWRVFYHLGAPYAHVVSFVDKFTVGTALSYAWIQMMVFLWGALLWVRDGRRSALAWVAAGAAGMLFFHGVVGLSVIPVALATFGLAWLLSFRWSWLPARGRLVALAVATLAGAAVATPYTASISAGWSAEKTGVPGHYFWPGWMMPWTLATALAAPAWFARRPLARIVRERSREGALLALFVLGMTAFACAVDLPQNNEAKFVFQVFIPLAIVGGAAFLPDVRAFLARRGALRGGAVLALLFLFAPAVLLVSNILDPGRHTAAELNPAPGEEALYAWVRDSTGDDAVLVDAGGRDLAMVKAQRRLWVGTTSGPEKAGFPLRALEQRRAVAADLFGPCAALAADARALGALGRPVYVLYRPGDAPGRAPWESLERRPDLFVRVYEREGFRFYRLR